MFGLFRSRRRCPVDAYVKGWIDDRWAWLVEEFGPAHVRSHPVILPTDEFFPDRYENQPACVERMLWKVAGYMDLDASKIEMEFFYSNAQFVERNAAGYYLPRDDGRYTIALNVNGIDDVEAVVATLAHELAHVHLLGHNRIDEDVPDHEILTDLLTVYFGMGIFTANSVVRERHIPTGQGTYLQVGKLGYLGMRDFAYALGKFAVMRGEEQPEWATHLRRDVRSALKQSITYMKADDPEPAAAPQDFSDMTEIRVMMVGRKCEQGLERVKFVRNAVQARVRLVEGVKDWTPLTAEICCEAVQAYAVEAFDLDAEVTLHAWDMFGGSEVGETVYPLIDAGLLPASEELVKEEFSSFGPLTLEPVAAENEEYQDDEYDEEWK